MIARLLMFPLMLSAQCFASPNVARVAMDWFRCPPVNPYNPRACASSCCYGGSNWDLTCIGFVEAAARKANGVADPQLRAGFPRVGQRYGSAVISFAAMRAAGRAHESMENVPVGAAVFFSISGFTPGHIAIHSGLLDSNGDPLIVSTGGASLTGIRLMPLSVLANLPGWKFLGWAEI